MRGLSLSGDSMSQTRAQQITELEAELVIVKAQMTAAASGAKSFTLGDFSVATLDYSSLTARRTAIEKSLQRLYRGGRGMFIDQSYVDSNATTELHEES